MRKTLALVLVVAMLASLVAVGSFADATTNVAAIIGTDGVTVGYLKADDLKNVVLEDGQTLQIINNIDKEIKIFVDGKNITVDSLAGYTVTAKITLVNSSAFSSAISSTGVATLKNLTLVDKGIVINGSMDVMLENVSADIRKGNESALKVENAAPAPKKAAEAYDVNITISGSVLQLVDVNADAVKVKAANNVTITNSTITSGKGTGVLIEESGSGSIAINNNSLINSNKIAIKATDKATVDITLVDSKITAHGKDGAIVFDGASNLYIENTTFATVEHDQFIKVKEDKLGEIVLVSAKFINSKNQPIKITNLKDDSAFTQFYIPKGCEKVDFKTTKTINLYARKIAASTAIAERGSSGNDEIKEIVSSAQNEIWNTREENKTVEIILSDAIKAIELVEAKLAAIEEINEATEDREESVLQLGSDAIVAINSAATIAEVDEAKSNGLAKIELLKAKYDAQYAVDAAAGTNDILQAYVDLVQEQIWNKNTVEEVKAVEKTILDAIELIKVKIAAVIELKDDRDENEDEAIVAIASAAIEAIKSSANSSAVAEILSQAIADIEFEVYTNDAQAAVAAEAEGETDEAIKAIESQAIADIENAETKAEIDTLKAEAIAAIKLIKAKIAAEAIIRGEIPAGTDARVVEIASNAIAEVWAKLGTDAVEEAKNAAIAAIKLGNAMVAAEAAVQAEVPADASAAVKEIESAAIANIWAAETEAEVEDIKSTAIAAIRAQILAENPVTADTTVWLVVVAAVAVLGSAVVSKKVFF